MSNVVTYIIPFIINSVEKIFVFLADIEDDKIGDVCIDHFHHRSADCLMSTRLNLTFFQLSNRF